jgi:hypothetical protein
MGVDYNYLPIRCRACGDTTHCLKDCSLRTGQSKFTPRQKTQEQQGTEVDSKGFQKPKYKGWRRPGPSSRGEGTIGSNSNSGGSGLRRDATRRDMRDENTGSLGRAACDIGAGTATRNKNDAPQQQATAQPKEPEQQRMELPAVNEQEERNMSAREGNIVPSTEPPGTLTHRKRDNSRTTQDLAGSQGTRNHQLTLYNARSAERAGGMSWSPERMSGRKRAGSPQGEGTLSTNSARRLNPLQDLNSSPTDGEGLDSSESMDVMNGGVGLLVQISIQSPRLPEDNHEEPMPVNRQEGMLAHPGILQMGVQGAPGNPLVDQGSYHEDQHHTLQSRSDEHSHIEEIGMPMSSSTPESRMEGPLSPGATRLLNGLGHSRPLQLQVREVREVAQGLEGTVLSAPRLGQAQHRLREERRIAEPYGNGVQMTRREIDYRIPMDPHGARRLMVISASPERALSSDRSLPWPE